LKLRIRKMNFIIPSKGLLNKLLEMGGLLSNKPALPVLENFLFEIANNTLTISSTDMETSMVTSIPVEAAADAKFAAPGKMLLNILRGLPDQPITFSLDEKSYVLKGVRDNANFEIACLNADDYPKLPEKQVDSTIKIPSNILLRAITKTSFATSNDELRMNLNGINLDIKNDRLVFVATDSNRLVRFTRTDIKPGFEGNVIIPKKPMNLLSKSLIEDDSEVLVEFNKTTIFFTYGETLLSCRLIAATYPAYEQVIPKDNEKELSVNRGKFFDALSMASLFANQATQQVRLKMSGNELLIKAEDLEMANKAEEKIPCSFEGDDLEIGFNARYLKDIISAIDSEDVVIKLSEPNRAGLVLPASNEDNEDITMLIMPMMLGQ
jgi:DNA polymerase III subunit beta